MIYEAINLQSEYSGYVRTMQIYCVICRIAFSCRLNPDAMRYINETIVDNAR